MRWEMSVQEVFTYWIPLINQLLHSNPQVAANSTDNENEFLITTPSTVSNDPIARGDWYKNIFYTKEGAAKVFSVEGKKASRTDVRVTLL